MKSIVVEIDDAGEISIEVNGVVGRLCELETKELWEGLGGTILESRKTAEYHQTRQAVKLIGNRR